MSNDARSALAKELRETVTRHRQLPDADWALDTDTLNRLQALYEKFAPDDPVERKGWLFSSWPDLPERYASNREHYPDRILAERLLLVEKIYTAEGLLG